LDLNFGDFHLLDVVANILLKSSAFIEVEICIVSE